MRWKCSFWNRSNTFTHICDFIRIFNYYFISFIFTKPLKLFEHFSSSSIVQRSLIFGILKTLTSHKYFTVFRISRIHKMNVTSCTYRLSEFFTKSDYSSVNFVKLIFGIKSSVSNHKGIVT